MHQSDLQFLLWALVAVIVFLIIKYYRLKSQLPERVHQRAQQEFDAWRSRELESVRSQLQQAAQMEAATALERWRIEKEEGIRADAVRRSSAITLGKVTEHLTPYLGIFPYNPKDVRFLGTPIDLIVFDGMNEGTIREIVFLEIKTGSSTLTTRERQIRDAVLEKRILWNEFRVGDA